MLCSPSPDYGSFSAIPVDAAHTPKYSLAWRSDDPQPSAGEALKGFLFVRPCIVLSFIGPETPSCS